MHCKQKDAGHYCVKAVYSGVKFVDTMRKQVCFLTLLFALRLLQRWGKGNTHTKKTGLLGRLAYLLLLVIASISCSGKAG